MCAPPPPLAPLTHSPLAPLAFRSHTFPSTGTILAVGTDGTGTADTVDYVRVYELDTAWALRETITGASLEASSAAYGIQARIANDGTTLVVGVPGHGAGVGDSYGTGLLKTYAWTEQSAPPPPSPPSSSKHSDAVLGGAIGGAIAGTILLGGGAYYVFHRTKVGRQGAFAPMAGQGAGFSE